MHERCVPARRSGHRDAAGRGVPTDAATLEAIYDKARLRTIVSSEHTTEELQTALDAFSRIGRELRLI